jgi:hypothetical protein
VLEVKNSTNTGAIASATFRKHLFFIDEGLDVFNVGPAHAADHARVYARLPSNSASSRGRENMGQWPVGSSMNCQPGLAISLHSAE